MVSGGVDGERVEGVGQVRPAGPDPLPVVSLEAAAPEAVAAFEVADPTLGAGAVARQAFAGAARPGLVAAGDEHALGSTAASWSWDMVGPKAPSSATSRGLSLSRSSSA